MLTFLRKIRKSLIESSSFRKYLIYAIGEVALVVIGILIALQINNWNEYRKDRIKEKKVLNEIVLTLKKNNDVVANRLYWVEKYQQSNEIVMQALDGTIPYSDTLQDHFWSARFSGVGNLSGSFSESGYTALKLTGYDIILSDTLKRNIVEIFESTIPLLTGSEVVSFYPELQDYYLRNFRDGGKSPNDFEKLKDDTYYYEMMSYVSGSRNRISNRMQQYLDKSERLLQRIDKILND